MNTKKLSFFGFILMMFFMSGPLDKVFVQYKLIDRDKEWLIDTMDHV